MVLNGSRAIAQLLRCVLLLAACGSSGAARAAAADLPSALDLPEEQRRALSEALLRRDSSPDDTGAASVNERAQAAPARAGNGSGTVTLGPESTVVIEILGTSTQLGDDRVDGERRAAAARKIPQGNPYRLDRAGRLQLPGFPVIPLNGLSSAQATQLLANEPALRGLQLRVSLLPLIVDAARAMEAFGYAMFEDSAGAFAPPANAPVPGDYVLGPGDTLRLSLVGTQNRRLTLEIDRNGEVPVPDIGPVVVAGMRFDEAKLAIESTISKRVAGVQPSVSMGPLRSIRIFILGEAKQAGSYVVNSLTTVSNALVLGGGVSRVGSLRNVQLKRKGKTLATLDLYDMLLRGDTTGDKSLEAGDVIFIPPVGATVGISGAVRRQAVYELRGQAPTDLSVAALIELAGGTRPDADAAMAVVERIDEARRRVVLNVDLRRGAARSFRLRTGDLVRIPFVRPTFTQDLRMEGHVHRPGVIGFVAGMRLTDALPSVEDLQADADLHYVLIRRELPPDRQVLVFSADLAAAWANPDGPQNVKLQARDKLTVFDLRTDRFRVIQPLIDELQRQSSVNAPVPIAWVRGEVKAPGEYPLERNMRLSDLLRAGGGLKDGAYVGSAELARHAVVDGERRVELLTVDLRALQAGDAGADIRISPFDLLIVKEVPQWDDLETISVAGEVRFPGEYPIRRGETLRSIIERAGGFTERAFLNGSIFTRTDLQRREQQQLDDLTERMRREIAVVALQAANGAVSTGTQSGSSAATLASGQILLDQVKSARAVGRLAIDMPALMVASDFDIKVREGDRLVVPPITQEVTIIGEVQNQTSLFYRPQLRRDDYIRMVGGTNPHADKSRIYVIRANGLAVGAHGSNWLQRSFNTDIQAGDVIVVPLEVGRPPTLALWTSVSTILYNIAIVVAAVHSL